MPPSGLSSDQFPRSRAPKPLLRAAVRFHFHFHGRLIPSLYAQCALFGSQDHDQAPPFHSRRKLHGAGFGALLNYTGHHRSTHFLVGHFTSPIGQRHFGLVAVGQEFFDLSDLYFEIMFIGPWAKLDFFHLRRFLVTPALVILFTQLKFIFPIVHDAANRRLGRRGDLHKVVAPVLCLTEGLCGRQYSELLAFRTNDSNFSNPDFPVYT